MTKKLNKRLYDFIFSVGKIISNRNFKKYINHACKNKSNGNDLITYRCFRNMFKRLHISDLVAVEMQVVIREQNDLRDLNSFVKLCIGKLKNIITKRHTKCSRHLYRFFLIRRMHTKLLRMTKLVSRWIII